MLIYYLLIIPFTYNYCILLVMLVQRLDFFKMLLCMVLMLIERDKSNPYTFIMGKGEWWTQENYFIQL